MVVIVVTTYHDFYKLLLSLLPLFPSESTIYDIGKIHLSIIQWLGQFCLFIGDTIGCFSIFTLLVIVVLMIHDAPCCDALVLPNHM